MSGGQRPTHMGQVIAVCGMPGSGKGEFADVIANEGVPVLSMGDMVRAEVRRRSLEESPGIFGEIAAQLRAEYGEDVLAVRLADAVDELLQKHQLVLIEGMRGTAERTVFSARWGERFESLAVQASADVRFARIQHRGRSEDGDRASFEVRDAREIGWGLDQIIDEANHTIDNNQDLESFKLDCQNWYRQYAL